MALRRVLLVTSLLLTGCTAPTFGWPAGLSSLFEPASPEPRFSREQAIAGAEAKMVEAPDKDAFERRMVLLARVGDIRSFKLPDDPDLRFFRGAMLPQFGVDQRVWIVAYRKGDPAKGPTLTYRYYVFESDTGELGLVSGGSSDPNYPVVGQ